MVRVRKLGCEVVMGWRVDWLSGKAKWGSFRLFKGVR